MKKSELVDAIAFELGDMSKSAVNNMLDALGEVTRDALNKGEEVTLPELVKFTVKDRPERQGRHPGTGEPMTIAAKRVPKITVLKQLKDSVA